jgi:hypothetical protein
VDILKKQQLLEIRLAHAMNDAEEKYLRTLEMDERGENVDNAKKLWHISIKKHDAASRRTYNTMEARYKKLGEHCFSFWIGTHGRAICVRLNRANQEVELSGIRDKEDVRCGAPLNWRVQKGYDLDWSQSDRQMQIAVRQFAKDDDWLEAR